MLERIFKRKKDDGRKVGLADSFFYSIDVASVLEEKGEEVLVLPEGGVVLPMREVGNEAIIALLYGLMNCATLEEEEVIKAAQKRIKKNVLESLDS